MDLFEEAIEKEVELRMKDAAEKLADNPDAVIAAYAKKLNDTQLQMEAMRNELEPKADFYDIVVQSSDWSEMTEVAKLIGIAGWGRNNIFALLRERSILRYNNEPYQQYVERGYFKLTEQHYINNKTGETMVNKKTSISQKGINFINKIIKES